MNASFITTSNRMAPHVVSPAAGDPALDKRHSAPSCSALAPIEADDDDDTAAASTGTSITKRYLQEENRDLRQHLWMQHELLYQTEKKKSNALLRVLRLQDRRWRKENQSLRDEVARLQYQLRHVERQQETPKNLHTTALGMHWPCPEDENRNANLLCHKDPTVSTTAPVEKRGYQVFKACTEKPLGSIDTEDNQQDELVILPAAMPLPPKSLHTTTTTTIENPFGEDSIVPTAVNLLSSLGAGGGPHGARRAPPSEHSESNIDLDDFYDCVSLISMYSSSARKDEKDKDNEKETEERNHHGKRPGGKKQRRWKTGACWKKLTT